MPETLPNGTYLRSTLCFSTTTLIIPYRHVFLVCNAEIA
jgi:hypothetical protein